MSVTPSGLHADGVTDDSATINTAIADYSAYGGEEIYLPAGRYAIGNSGGLVMKPNVKLRGGGITTVLVALDTCTDAVITTDPLAYDYGVAELAIDGRYYSGGGQSHGIHTVGSTTTPNPDQQSQFIPAGKPSTYGALGYYLPAPPSNPIGFFDHISILHTYGHSIFVDHNCVGVVFSNIYAQGAGGALHSSFDAEAVNLAVNGATDCFFSNHVIGSGYAGCVYLLNVGDIQIANSKFWNPGLYLDPSSGAQLVYASAFGVTIDGLGHHLISNCETQYTPGNGLHIVGSFGNKIDLLTENSGFGSGGGADVMIEGDSYDNDLDVRGRANSAQPPHTAGVIYSGTSIVTPNRTKYRRDADYFTSGHAPLYALQSGAGVSQLNGLDLGDHGFVYETGTTWAPTDLQAADVFFFQVAAGTTVTLGDLSAGKVEPGKVITIVVQQSGGSSLAYSPGATWYSKPSFPSANGIYTFRFCNMSSNSTPYWVQV